MKIAILSDTHGLLRPEVLAQLEGADAILHAGDIDTPAVADCLQDYALLYAVRGNNDWRSWADPIPRSRRVSLAGLNFFLVHNRRDVPPYLDDMDVVVYGHTHRYACAGENGVLWLNPGSCSRPRLTPERTMVLMDAENGAFQLERIVLAP